uniref:Uncharacterized protein n=1 Tax=Quercus lobata TaxID=97700 RepID=A0A7N2L0Z2_QUELO
MVTSRDVIFDEAFTLKQNEAETCDDSPREKLTVNVEFAENSSPNDKGDVEIDPQQQQEESYSIAKAYTATNETQNVVVISEAEYNACAKVISITVEVQPCCAFHYTLPSIGTY